MNPKITYAILGVIFVVMALIIVNQITTEPELEPEVVSTTPQANETAQNETTDAPAVAQRQAMQEQPTASEQAAPRTETAAREPMTPPGEKPAAAPVPERPTPQPTQNRTTTPAQIPSAQPETVAAANQNRSESAATEETAAQAEPTPEQPAENATQQTALAGDTAAGQPESLEQAAENMSNPAPGYEPIKPQELKHENTLRLVTVEQRGGSMILKLQADEPIGRYKYFTLGDPSRLVVDLIGEWEQKSPGVKMPENELFRRVRFGRHDNKLRIVADLATTAYTEPVVVQDPPTELVVSLRKK